ncbi:helix-loop-helix DNA-binding domain-containing protein [Hypoxylon sp. FL1150]|nr:helix-loop-helix DNA-binding domain-containing protein [Hypoxylon sp. FL1150]
MAMMDTGDWNGHEQTLPSTGDDDFQQFLNMGGMSGLGDDLPYFQDFSAGNSSSMMHQPHGDTIDTPMSNSNVPTIMARNDLSMQSQMSSMTSAPSHPSISTQIMPPHHTPRDSISEIDAQIQFLQQQRLQQQRRQLAEEERQFHEQQAAFFAQQRNIVPPTPQSLEMQAANTFHFAHHDQAHSSGMFDGYHLKEQSEISFTPLVSPAVTPLDPHFPVDPGFPHSGPYFSPLTSPALHAQNESASTFDHRQSGHTTNSPVEMDIDPSPVTSTPANIPKKVRKSNANKTRKASVRQSPITKAQRRGRKGSTPVINAQVLSELAESTAESAGNPPKPMSVSATSTEESENASVSPEALSEMPPPPLPLPRSARQSPYMQPQTNGNRGPITLPGPLAGKPSPATPASLFRISPKSKSADASHPEQSGSEHIESFELPESVNFSKPDLPSLDTQQPPPPHTEEEIAKAATFQPSASPVLPKPTRSATASATQSPQLTPKSGTPNLRKTPLIAPRGPKKRPSVSSISPALRPRISPSIKPLLPGTPGMSAEDSASRLLATKSNYQNILEGNTVPGVSYPSELSTNLTSKRTSHKIAEQGRRNRINSALQEIATLLPKGSVKELSEGDGEGGNGDKKDGKQSNTPNSKASTVESAIAYIKQLQEEIVLANRRADEAEKKLEKAAVS